MAQSDCTGLAALFPDAPSLGFDIWHIPTALPGFYTILPEMTIEPDCEMVVGDKGV